MASNNPFSPFESGYDSRTESNTNPDTIQGLLESATASTRACLNQNAFTQTSTGSIQRGGEKFLDVKPIQVNGYIANDNPSNPRSVPAPLELNPIYPLSQPAQQERFAPSFYGCRPDGLDNKVAYSLTEADKRMLSRMETAFLQGNVPELAKLIDSVRPQREGHNAEKEYFSHALEVFRTELYSMGFDATYNWQTGALSINNQENRSTGHAYLKSLVIDPSKQTVVAERVAPSSQSRDRISFNWATKQVDELCTQFQPEFKQFSQKSSPEQFESKYLDLLRDKIDLHFEHVRHEKLAAQNERIERALQEHAERERKQREEFEQRERDIRLGITPRAN